MTIINYRIKVVYYCVLAFILLGISAIIAVLNTYLIPLLSLTIVPAILLYFKLEDVISIVGSTKAFTFDDSLLYYKRDTKLLFSFVQNGEMFQVPYKSFKTHDKDYILYDMKTCRLTVPENLQYTLLHF